MEAELQFMLIQCIWTALNDRQHSLEYNLIVSESYKRQLVNVQLNVLGFFGTCSQRQIKSGIKTSQNPK